MIDPTRTETGPSPVAPPARVHRTRLGAWWARQQARIAALSRSKHAHAAMLAVSVVDGSVLPVPPFTLLVPMVLAERRKWFLYATTGTVASLIGGLIGYGLGHLGLQRLIEFVGVDTELPIVVHWWIINLDTTLRALLTDNFWMLALLCSILPTPYKVVAIGSGIVGVGFPEFVLASLIGRTVRMYGVAGAVAFFGERASRWLRL